MTQIKNDGKFVIYLTDNLGKRIDSRFDITKENNYNKMNLNSGIYFIEVFTENGQLVGDRKVLKE